MTTDRYTVVDDFGNLINPMLAEGQVHGGVAQGVGQAVQERVVYDEDGQLLTASFMDYALPRASRPSLHFLHLRACSIDRQCIMGMKGLWRSGNGGRSGGNMPMPCKMRFGTMGCGRQICLSHRIGSGR